MQDHKGLIRSKDADESRWKISICFFVKIHQRITIYVGMHRCYSFYQTSLRPLPLSRYLYNVYLPDEFQPQTNGVEQIRQRQKIAIRYTRSSQVMELWKTKFNNKAYCFLRI
ncbi:MAG: hypothetical protein DI535_26005 [Citrobacter freundii]|nr:MAG: hypothetical protein DI535_26005 [Citrobacter freundii]